MSSEKGFVEWKEVFVSSEKGNRVVHYYFKDTNGNSILAVIGTERSVRHMVYVVADQFYQAYGSQRNITCGFKWRSKREVVDWLTCSLVKHHPHDFSMTVSPKYDPPQQALGFSNFSTNGFDAPRDNLFSEHTSQIATSLKSHHTSDISWSGDSWICSKQLTHYPAFCRNGITIDAHSFVFVMAKEDNHYLAYLEDMYEDRKGLKKVRARWFHDNREVARVVTLPNRHSREVFITPHAQVISAECIDGPATVLTPQHYEKCSAAIPNVPSTVIHLCSRQFRKNKLKPFDVSRLKGYYNQKILLTLGGLEEQELAVHGDGTLKHGGAKKTRSCRGGERFVTSNSGLRVSAQRGPMTTDAGPTYQNLKIRPTSYKVNDKIELLCQDSGIRGCWFKCTVLQISRKQLKVQYDDVQDEDGCGNLEEWIPSLRLAAPDKLRMRCLGRPTIRPCPCATSSQDVGFEIGSPVDAQWNDGWWEGVVTRIDNSGDDTLQVYFPGEDIYSSFERKKVRISKDWLRNEWVDVASRPDVVSLLSPDVSPGMKLSACSSIAKGTESGSSGEIPIEDIKSKKRPRTEEENGGGEYQSEQVEMKLDTIEENNQELEDDLKKQPRVKDL
ncbi:hypothetical protein ACHQM5_025534 [Ranunculus cassubicifolius]